MTKHLGWLGLLAGLALVPSACDGDDDTVGSGGSGNAPSAGKGGGGGKGGKGGANGASGEAGSGTSTGGTSGKAGRGGSNGSGGSGNTSGSASTAAGASGDDTSGSGAPGSGGTGAAPGAGGEGAAAGQPGAAGQTDQGGNGGEGGEGQTVPFELAGSWQNTDFGETDVIGTDTWSQDYGFGVTVSAIIKFSNEENYAIRQAPHDAQFDPDTFDRTVWTEVDGDHFYYCTIDHGLATAEDAEASTTPVDASNPDVSGCGNFSWTKLTAM